MRWRGPFVKVAILRIGMSPARCDALPPLYRSAGAPGALTVVLYFLTSRLDLKARTLPIPTFCVI